MPERTQNPVMHEAYRKYCREAFADNSWVQDIHFDEQPTHTYDNFLSVTEQVYEQFQAAHQTDEGHPVIPEMVAYSGLQVIGVGIFACSSAYQEYCQQTDQSPNKEVALEALRSSKTNRFFVDIASVQRFKNREFETWFGLRSGQWELGVAPFVYSPVGRCVLPTREVFNHAKKEMEKRAEWLGESKALKDPAPNHCPALADIPKAWHIVLEASNQAGLFDFEDATTEVTARTGMVE